MPLDHDGARTLMAQAMEGKLSADDERELALHLVGCAECKAIYEGLQSASPALTSIDLGTPSVESLDAAVHRAVTVLRGEADPGPMGLSEEPPRLPDDDANFVRIDSGLRDDDARPVGSPPPTGPMDVPVPRNVVPEAHVRPIDPQPTPVPASGSVPASTNPLDISDDDDDGGFFEMDSPGARPPTEADIALPPIPPDVPLTPPDVVEPADAQPPHTDEIVIEPPPAPAQPEESVFEPASVTAERYDDRTEVERLLDEDRARYEPLQHADDIDDDDRMGPGPWLAAIAVTVVLAVLAAIVVFRGGNLFGSSGGDLPSVSEVRKGIADSVGEMKSLKAGFTINKLNLYRVGHGQSSLVYNFANGTYDGHITYDRNEGYKQDFTLNVGTEEIERAEILQTPEETRGLVGNAADRTVVSVTNPALGPPDGDLRPKLGLLEDSLGTASGLLAESKDLKVGGKLTRDGRTLYQVSGTVRATELSRADKIEAAVDAKTLLPVIIKRSISRSDARVLGPESALSEDAIDKAFGTNDRVTTELLTLKDYQYDEIVLPNDLILDVPSGVEEQKSEGHFERLTHAEISTKLDYRPLLPRTLPAGYEEDLLADFTGTPALWGPGNTLPKAKHVFHAEYFNGRTTIVISERTYDTRFSSTGDPLQRTGLPITTRTVTRNDHSFTFGTSPEVPPHAWGWLGNTFVMATGYTSQNELARILASLAEIPTAVPGSAEIPSPSPGASTAPSSSPSATSSPASTGLPGD